MTMQNDSHPDDERLAAYAGGDPDALTDPTLVAHLSACDRCRPLVDELSLLRSALARLPDVAPSRPLRLIPPVPAASAPRPTPLAWLRRLAGPAMAAGAGLVLVGAIGVSSSGAIGDLLSKGAIAGAARPSPSDRVTVPVLGAGSPLAVPGVATDSAEYRSGAGAPHGTVPSPQASPPLGFEAAGGNDDLSTGTAPEQPWLTLLIAGVALFVMSAVLRFSISPRAG